MQKTLEFVFKKRPADQSIVNPVVDLEELLTFLVTATRQGAPKGATAKIQLEVLRGEYVLTVRWEPNPYAVVSDETS